LDILIFFIINFFLTVSLPFCSLCVCMGNWQSGKKKNYFGELHIQNLGC